MIRREVCRVGFDQRNPKPETRNRLLKLVSNCETRNPKPTLKTYYRTDRTRTRNPNPETDSEDLISPGPIETRNPKPTVKVGFELRNPKPETRNRQCGFQSTKPETQNPKPIARVGFKRRNPKPETWNPKPETYSESGFQATKPKTRNPKPTAKVGFKRRNPKPTAKVGFKRRHPKPETRNRLESDFWVALRIGTQQNVPWFIAPSKYTGWWFFALPLWKMMEWVRQLGWWHSIPNCFWEKRVPNHRIHYEKKWLWQIASGKLVEV